METIDEYLRKTESATRKLFEGIDSYMDILREARPPLYDPATEQKEEGMMEFEEWHEAHQEDYTSVLLAQEKFIDEAFAMSCLSGAVLQLASMGIQKYSKVKRVTPGFQCVIKGASKMAKFCVGRHVRNIPIGLIVYAGRNQFNHWDEECLREPNRFIFEKLCVIESITKKGAFYRDPAFDLATQSVLSYADNIRSILKWNDYDAYSKDMRDMVG